jgi:hypothetical protein
LGFTVNGKALTGVLARAIALAQDASFATDEHWADITRRVGASPSRTHVTALGTALLAKATYPDADALSIKKDWGPNTYSQRGVGNRILVPLSRNAEYRYHPGRLGREPLNNQPYFRYDHMSVIERSRADGREALEIVIAELGRLNEHPEEALPALVAWLRERHLSWLEMPEIDLAGLDVALDAIAATADEFLDPSADDVPARAQAFAAGCFDISGWSRVSMGGLNDPSRRVPGDVHAYLRSSLVAAVEVRAKGVSDADVVAFLEQCMRHAPPIPRAIVAILGSPPNLPLAVAEIARRGREAGVVVSVVESHSELLDRVLAWSTIDVQSAIELFPDAVAKRLEQIDATPQSRQLWADLWSEVAMPAVVDLPERVDEGPKLF